MDSDKSNRGDWSGDQGLNDRDTKRPVTFGERAVGITFNPNQSLEVLELKRMQAEFIDRCNDLRAGTEDGEVKRMLSIAITEAQSAQMWSVKAVTWS